LKLYVKPSPLLIVTLSNNTSCLGSILGIFISGGQSYTYNGIMAADTLWLPAITSIFTIMATGTNQCKSDTAINIIVNNNISNLALATTANLQSNAGADSMNQTQPDGTMLNYLDINCNLIATIDDSTGGNLLGNTMAQVNVETTVPTYNGQPYLRRWYEITPTNQGAAIVTLYFTQEDFDSYNLAAPTWPQLPINANDITGINNIRITKIHGVLGVDSGVVITPTISFDSTGNYWSATFNVDSFSQFFMHGANLLNSPLALQLINFSGKIVETTDVLTWRTSNEINNHHFNIMHSKNANSFSEIGQIISTAKDANAITSYSIINEHPTAGHNYYTLQSVSIDGKIINYSKVIDLYRTLDGSIVSIYPNPTNDHLNIDFNSANNQNVTIKILDISGRILKQIETTSTKGANNYKIEMSEIANGIYTVQLLLHNKLNYTGLIEKK
jgi:hypothetical protein